MWCSNVEGSNIQGEGGVYKFLLPRDDAKGDKWCEKFKIDFHSLNMLRAARLVPPGEAAADAMMHWLIYLHLYMCKHSSAVDAAAASINIAVIEMLPV